MVGDCREIIMGRLPQLTSKETRLAQYILTHYEEVLYYNVSELAKNANVSDATVVRFCKSVGYRGFTDFKMNAARDLVPVEKQFDPILEKGDNVETVCRKVFTSEINVLNRTLLGLDLEIMKRVAEKIYRAKRLAFFATGGSHVVAKDAQHKFLKIGMTAIAHDDIDLQLMSSALLTRGDVAVCISFSGSNYHVVNCMKAAKKNGAYCIGIISQVKSPLGRLVNDVLCSAYDETIFQSESISTRIAQLAIIDAIVNNVAFYDYEKFNQMIGRTREATSESKY
ncbi:DNA-binding MurR/RpiR family transcriptional regulator [Moryella indoligenes]|uniref:DNA-binding MurR/RpiR family transcriptional regulator n=1 Tax=Moryella indoligenes TaxID=371674 RepID=A0AAE3VAR2_9FIRM|nr:MurR/RpiR family transcriptional regulator [Moryella indoligenes]MDQ0152841.1 DNA-binding MurR/RpiR family transcriptional regulator [Moryella indoligenes]